MSFAVVKCSISSVGNYFFRCPFHLASVLNVNDKCVAETIHGIIIVKIKQIVTSPTEEEAIRATRWVFQKVNTIELNRLKETER